MPTTFCEVLPAAKSGPAAVDWTPAGPGRGTVTVSQKRCRCAYHVREQRTDWPGRAFAFEKAAGTPGSDPTEAAYAVFVGRAGDARCDCKGFERWRTCKHVEAARALLANGWLDRPAE